MIKCEQRKHNTHRVGQMLETERGRVIMAEAWAHYLHGDCFIEGHCDPEEFVVRLIRDTAGYTRDAERLT